MIRISNLCKEYRSKGTHFTALKNISLEIDAGESVAIMGKSGAGKTTLLNIIGGIDSFDSGEYYLNGKSMRGLKDAESAKIRNKTIGFVIQDFALIEDKPVLFNAALPMYFSKTPWSKMQERAKDVVDIVGSAEQANKKVNQLSGGQKQRAAIARAIVNSPQVILADEPTGALDSSTSTDIMKTLMGLNLRGITVIIVTHDDIVAKYCKREIVLADGEIVSDAVRA